MSHNRYKNPDKYADFEGFFYRCMLVCMAGFLLLFATNAAAATNTGLKTQKNPSKVLKADLSELAHRDIGILDWQSQSLELNFDLPKDNWYESLDLFLTVIPEGQVSSTAPITISYNGEKPIPLYGKSSRFDAHIRLDPARIRTKRNVLKITYKTPHKEACLTQAHGKWIVDFSKSKIVTKTRAKSRAMMISEVETRLSHPMTAPKRVSIRAFGDNKEALEALAAQAIGGRMKTLPSFQFTAHNADFDIVAGPRDEIKTLVNDKHALNSEFSSVFMDKGQRPKLVITGYDDDQVEALMKNFARFHLPKARRRSASMNEFYAAGRLQPRAIIDAGKYELSDIGDTTIVPSWRPKPAELAFNVADPMNSEGKLVLNIMRGANLDAASRIRVLVNDQSVGYTVLDKKKKFVSFDIEPSLFKPAANTLKIEPVLAAPANGNTCASPTSTPALLVSKSSKLKIKTRRHNTQADLSRFAASGMPTSGQNDDTAIVLTARSNADRAASLRFFAYASQQFGPRLAQAEYITDMSSVAALDKNLLIIGPNALRNEELLAAAPSALKLALRGKPATGPRTLQVAILDRYASSAGTTYRTAQQLGKDARIQNGGIASMFASPYRKDRIVGVITSDQPSRYAAAMNNVTQPGFWNGLQGSVARWNKNTIMMAQTGLSLPSVKPAKPNGPSFKESASTAFGNAKNWMSSLLPQSRAPKQRNVKPVPTPTQKPATANAPQPVIKLRGAVRPEQLERKTEFKNPLAGMKLPKMEGFKSGFQEKYTAVATSFQNMQATGFDWRPIKKWARARTEDRNTVLFIIALSIFLMIGLASPKLSEDK